MSNNIFVKGMSTSADNILIKVSRFLGSAIIILLTWLLNALSTIIENINAISPLSLFGIENTYNTHFVPLSLAILGVVISIYAYKYMSSNNETLQNIIQKIIIIVFIIVFMIPMSTTIMDLVFTPLTKSSMSKMEEGLGTTIVLENVVDMQETLINDNGTIVYMNNELKEQEKNIKNNFIFYGGIDSKLMDHDKLPEKYKKKKLENVNGVWYSRDLAQGWFEWDEEVYRYSYNFWAIASMEIAVSIAILFGAIIFARIYIFEIPFALLLSAPLLASATTLDKVKKIVSELLNMLLGLVILLYSIDIYIKWSTLIASSNINELAKVIIYIAGAIFIISGSQFYTRVTGYDPGVKDGLLSMYGANTALQGANAIKETLFGKDGVTKKPKKALSTVGNKFNELGGTKFKEGLNTGFKNTKAGERVGGIKSTFDTAKEKMQDRAFNAGQNIGSVFNSAPNDLDTGIPPVGKTDDENTVKPFDTQVKKEDNKSLDTKDNNSSNKTLDTKSEKVDNKPLITKGNTPTSQLLETETNEVSIKPLKTGRDEKTLG